MARSLYVPVHLHARLVLHQDAPVAVPTLDAAPCAAPAGPPLAPGVHLHWALPDALTRGEIREGSRRLCFPALPDCWIVVRFASARATAAAPDAPPPPRACKAFVVDAKLKVPPRPYGQLSLAPDRESRWLTAVGLLPDGEAPEETDPSQASRHLDAAYYPSARDRFGFHDDLADLAKPKTFVKLGGSAPDWSGLHLSYAVIGYYTSPAEDPLARADDDHARLDWIERARLRVELPERCLLLPVGLHDDIMKAARPLSSGALLLVGADGRMSALSSADCQPVIAAKSHRLGEIVEKVNADLALGAANREALAGFGLRQIDLVASVPEASSGVPSRLVCHGAVVDVGPAGAHRHEAPTSEDVDIADSASAAIEQAFLEIGGGEVFAVLRGGFDGELGSTAGQQSLPHLLHAAGFDASPQEAPAREHLAVIVDPGAGPLPADPAIAADTPLRVIDRRTAPGHQPLPFGVRFDGLAKLRADLGPALVRVEARDVPRPRWHRPATPVLCFDGHGRSFRHGHDGRMQQDGLLQCRAGGQTVSTLAYYNLRLGGHNLVELDPVLRFAPQFVRELLHEVALLDPTNAARAAALALQAGALDPTPAAAGEAFDTFCHATRGWWPLADPSAAPPQAVALFTGTLPAPLAVTPWSAPWLPLYAELSYTFRPDCTDRTSGLSLGPVDLAVVDKTTAPAVTAADRQVLSSMLPGTVQSAIARLRAHFGKSGDVKTQLDELVRRIADLDLMTVSLGELDPALRARGHALRGGTLAITSLRLVDTFGTVRSFEQSLPQRIMPPRLTHWARVNARLVGLDGDADAGPLRSPVCGFFLFDAVEQALEVFDPAGAPIGQLRHDRATQKTAWEAAPSRSRAELAGVQPTVLRDITEAMLAPPVGTPPGPSALRAALGVLDAARFSVARRLPGDDHRAALCGRPVVVLRAHLTLELAGLGASDRPQGSAPSLPDKVRVRLGCLDQLDDGLLGFFLRDGDKWHLHTVPHAAGDASKSPYTLTHPLVLPDTSFELAPGPQGRREVLLLLDGLSSFHVQTGLLPRKRIDTSELVPARVVAQVLPTLAVGPLLFEPARRRVPAPPLPGNTWSWVHASATGFVEAPLAAFAPALSELPDAPPAVHEGWLRLDLDESQG